MEEQRPVADRNELIAAVGSGRPVRWLFFWGHVPPTDSPPTGGPSTASPSSRAVGRHVLSQWFAAPFVVDGVTYATAEHWMMAAKARLFDDRVAERAAIDAGHPAEAQAAGRLVRGFDDAVWKAERSAIVVAGSVAKFGADPVLRDYLLGTGDRVLVEASPRDRIWGIGLAADDPRAEVPSAWPGQNLLGFALMEARRRLSGQV